MAMSPTYFQWQLHNYTTLLSKIYEHCIMFLLGAERFWIILITWHQTSAIGNTRTKLTSQACLWHIYHKTAIFVLDRRYSKHMHKIILILTSCKKGAIWIIQNIITIAPPPFFFSVKIFNSPFKRNVVH